LLTSIIAEHQSSGGIVVLATHDAPPVGAKILDVRTTTRATENAA
jgi:ABC-type transport system involved in cytochrome c biogenesis ATPase subunit